MERHETHPVGCDRHLFTDSSLPSYDPDAAALVVQRSKELVARLG